MNSIVWSVFIKSDSISNCEKKRSKNMAEYCLLISCRINGEYHTHLDARKVRETHACIRAKVDSNAVPL